MPTTRQLFYVYYSDCRQLKKSLPENWHLPILKGKNTYYDLALKACLCLDKRHRSLEPRTGEIWLRFHSAKEGKPIRHLPN